MTSVQKRSRRGEEAEHEIKWKEKKFSRPDILLVVLFLFKISNRQGTKLQAKPL